MITDKDITKLKKVFVTKDEMENALDKRTDIIVKDVRTVIELVGDMSLQLEKIGKKLDKKTTEHDDMLEHHQRQIDKLNDKVFPAL